MERPRISSKRDSWLKQNTWKFCTKPLLMVYKIEWVYLLLCQRPICKTGGNDVYFKAHDVPWGLSESSNAVNTCGWNYHRILAHGFFSSVVWNQAVLLEWVMPCKERDDSRYAWENITFFRSRWKLASLSSSEVIHFNFIIMVNFKSSGFDKGTGGKSGKFQFDCDGCILFTRRSINITNSFSFSLYNLPFLYCFSQQSYRLYYRG